MLKNYRKQTVPKAPPKNLLSKTYRLKMLAKELT